MPTFSPLSYSPDSWWVRARPGQRQQQGAPCWPPPLMQKHKCCICCLPGALKRSWVGSRGGTWSQAAWDAGIPSSGEPSVLCLSLNSGFWITILNLKFCGCHLLQSHNPQEIFSQVPCVSVPLRPCWESPVIYRTHGSVWQVPHGEIFLSSARIC